MNVRSAAEKIDDIIAMKRDQSIDVLCLCETWHDEDSVSIRRLRTEGKHFDSHPLSVKPQTVTLGNRIDVHESVSRIAYDSCQYISIEETVRSLLHSKAYAEVLFSDKCSHEIIADWQDGVHLARHKLISDKSKITLMIQLFYDSMGL